MTNLLLKISINRREVAENEDYEKIVSVFLLRRRNFRREEET